MDKETEQYYNSLQDIFVMEGWKELMKELSATLLT
jgi:hypothetical protein